MKEGIIIKNNIHSYTTRTVDELGRIVIPKEIRHCCAIFEGDSFEIITEDGAIKLIPHKPYAGVLEELERFKKVVDETYTAKTNVDIEKKNLVFECLKDIEDILNGNERLSDSHCEEF